MGGGAGIREAGGGGGPQEGGDVVGGGMEERQQESAGRVLYRDRLEMLVGKWGLAPNACGWLLMRLLRPEQSAVTGKLVASAEDDGLRAK